MAERKNKKPPRKNPDSLQAVNFAPNDNPYLNEPNEDDPNQFIINEQREQKEKEQH